MSDYTIATTIAQLQALGYIVIEATDATDVTCADIDSYFEGESIGNPLEAALDNAQAWLRDNKAPEKFILIRITNPAED